jgi:hypothetical protein
MTLDNGIDNDLLDLNPVAGHRRKAFFEISLHDDAMALQFMCRECKPGILGPPSAAAK